MRVFIKPCEEEKCGLPGEDSSEALSSTQTHDPSNGKSLFLLPIVGALTPVVPRLLGLTLLSILSSFCKLVHRA